MWLALEVSAGTISVRERSVNLDIIILSFRESVS